jgi:hypothetical protein
VLQHRPHDAQDQQRQQHTFRRRDTRALLQLAAPPRDVRGAAAASLCVARGSKKRGILEGASSIQNVPKMCGFGKNSNVSNFKVATCNNQAIVHATNPVQQLN